MGLHIAGIGTSVPDFFIDQTDAAEVAARFFVDHSGQRKLLPVMYRRSGVKTRHSMLLTAPELPLDEEHDFYATACDTLDRGPTTRDRMERYEEGSGPLAVEASRSAIVEADIDLAQITHLVTVSCSGFAAPGFDVEIIRDLGLSAGVARTHVGFMGCHGALNGLRVARAFTEADPDACVLLCAVELCSLHYYYGWDPEKMVANALFADGAAAVVAFGSERAGSDSAAGNGAQVREDDTWQVQVIDNGSAVFPDSEDAMTWRIGDHGFEMTLSTHVPDLIHRYVGPWLTEWLGGHGLSIEAINAWGVHPGGPRILDAFLEATGLPESTVDVSRKILANFGNMSSPTVLFVLNRLRRRGAKPPCVLLGFGPGLAVEAALLM